MHFVSEEIFQLLLALLVGGIIGIEREYSNKSAGFRTMILISLGSTLYMILSQKLGTAQSDDRIAANIITGIGFIGAGVVFKEGMNVTGLTTAASIWVTAALGMAIGSHHYSLAGIGAILTIIVLFLFGYFQNIIDRLHHTRNYRVVLHNNQQGTKELKLYMQSIGLTCRLQTETKNDAEIHFSFGVAGKKKKIQDFNAYLLTAGYVKSFEC